MQIPASMIETLSQSMQHRKEALKARTRREILEDKAYNFELRKSYIYLKDSPEDPNDLEIEEAQCSMPSINN